MDYKRLGLFLVLVVCIFGCRQVDLGTVLMVLFKEYT